MNETEPVKVVAGSSFSCCYIMPFLFRIFYQVDSHAEKYEYSRRNAFKEALISIREASTAFMKRRTYECSWETNLLKFKLPAVQFFFLCTHSTSFQRSE